MTAKKRSPLLYELCIVLCCLAWGLGNPIVKIGFQTLTPFLYSSLRFAAALVIFLIFGWKRIVRAARTNHIGHVLLISVFNGAAYVLGATALNYAEATITSFLMSVSVIFTPLIAYLVLRRRFDPVVLPAIAVSVAGLYLICGNTGAFTFGQGEVMALACSVCMSASVVYAAKYSADLDLTFLAAVQCLVALLFSLPVYFLTESWIPFSRYTGSAVFSLVFAALFSTCMPFLLQNLAVRHIPPTVVSITFVLEPVFTALFSYLLLGETLTAAGAFGGALIICGVVLATLIQNGALSIRRRKKESQG